MAWAAFLCFDLVCCADGLVCCAVLWFGQLCFGLSPVLPYDLVCFPVLLFGLLFCPINLVSCAFLWFELLCCAMVQCHFGLLCSPQPSGLFSLLCCSMVWSAVLCHCFLCFAELWFGLLCCAMCFFFAVLFYGFVCSAVLWFNLMCCPSVRSSVLCSVCYSLVSCAFLSLGLLCCAMIKSAVLPYCLVCCAVLLVYLTVLWYIVLC